MDTRKAPRFIEDAKRLGVDANPLDAADICDIIRDVDTAHHAELESPLTILS